MSPSPPPAATAPEAAARRHLPWSVGPLATVLGSSVAAFDPTVVGIALPAIGRDFRVGLASLQWVVTAYMLTLAGLLLVGGSLGDRFGRRRVFVVGVVWFAAASLLCGSRRAPWCSWWHVRCRGVGGALLTPGSLAILEASFASADRSRAIGAWSGLGGWPRRSGRSSAAGSSTDAVSWRLVFFINPPLAVVVVTVWHVPESRDPGVTGGVDLPGGLLRRARPGRPCLRPDRGSWTGLTSPVVLGSLAVGVAALALLLLVESRVRAPVLPLSIFRSRQFRAANAVTFMVYAASAAPCSSCRSSYRP